MNQQLFVTAVQHPWVLVRTQGNGQPGRRPPTRVAWLEYDAGDYYDGGPIHRDREGLWRFSYKHQQRIAKSDVLHVFRNLGAKGIPGSAASNRRFGPTNVEVRRAKAALPKITEEEYLA